LHDLWQSPGLVHYIYIFGGSCPLTEFCQVQNSLCVKVLRSPILAALLHGTRAVGVSQTLRRGIFTRQGGRPVRHWVVELLRFQNYLTCRCSEHFYVVHTQRGGAVVQRVRNLGLRSVGRGFKSCSRQRCVTMLGKLFTPTCMCLCHQAV